MNHSDRFQLDAAAWDRLLAPCSSPGRAFSHERLAGKRVPITGAGGSIRVRPAHGTGADVPQTV